MEGTATCGGTPDFCDDAYCGRSLGSYEAYSCCGPLPFDEYMGMPPLLEEYMGMPPLFEAYMGMPPLLEEQIGMPPLVEEYMGLAARGLLDA